MEIKTLAASILCLSGMLTMSAQQKTTVFTVDFKVNSAVLSPEVSNNREVLEDLNRFLKEASDDASLKVTAITYRGYASPEGPISNNDYLSEGRCQALENYVNQRASFPDAVVSHQADVDVWSEVIKQLENSDYKYARKALEILQDDSHETRSDSPYAYRVAKLRAVENGRIWSYIDQNILAPMRNAQASFVTFTVTREEPKQVLVEEPPVYVEEVTEEVVAPVEEVSEEGWRPRLDLKTNAIGWAMMVSNAAVEWEFAPHWSATLPVYYSAMNYFKRTWKYRTFAIQPELRYWFRQNNNDGLFIGAHFGLAYYNVAIGGTYRFQDHNGRHPALGGGLAIGYRIPISRDRKWKMEFTAGAGAYRLWTDHFRNEANGPLIYQNKKTFFCLDQAAVTFMYVFDLGKKGGAK